MLKSGELLLLLSHPYKISKWFYHWYKT